jgi:hypothetical protein
MDGIVQKRPRQFPRCQFDDDHQNAFVSDGTTLNWNPSAENHPHPFSRQHFPSLQTGLRFSAGGALFLVSSQRSIGSALTMMRL